MSSAPTCCNRPMGRSNGQWVCGKCGSWANTGTAPRPSVTVAATEVTR